MQILSILCVDDEPAILHTLALVLRHHGHTVLTASNSAQALTLAGGVAIDLVLLDYSICDREHLCLYERLRERQPQIKAILHTGNPTLTECLGRVPVLAKPVDPRAIAARIEQIFAGGDGDATPAN